MKRKQSYAPFVIGLLALLLTWTSSHFTFFRIANLQLVDRFFAFREGGASAEVAPEIQLVLIDEETYKHLAEPPVLWTSYYTRVISGLLEAGARAVAFDGVPSYADERACAEFNALVSQHPGKVLLGYYLRERKGAEPIVVMPPEGMLPLLRPGGLGRLNLAHDEDGCADGWPSCPFHFLVTMGRARSSHLAWRR